MKKNNFIIDILEKSKDEIKRLKEDIFETSKLFYLGEIKNGLEKIKVFSDIFCDFSFFWNDVYEETKDEELYRINVEFSQNISNLTKAIEDNDFILIGDHFYFYLPKTLDKYFEIIPKLKNKIKDNGKNI